MKLNDALGSMSISHSEGLSSNLGLSLDSPAQGVFMVFLASFWKILV
jgi:hypothetical protein